MYQDTPTFDGQQCEIIKFPIVPRDNALNTHLPETPAQEILHPSFISRVKNALERLTRKPDNFKIGDHVRLLASNRKGWIVSAREVPHPINKNVYCVMVEKGGPHVPAYPEFLEHVRKEDAKR